MIEARMKAAYAPKSWRARYPSLRMTGKYLK